ncbi:MAG: UvrD-helicase domain-containing protein [Bacteroidales bacterium]|nr:UvrD-helicase domain-containing protein [Bacteroidales bacterium]
MKLKIYKASAGSGKTYNLTENYLKSAFKQSSANSQLYSAFADSMAFSKILAVTFTNKAAGEMKDRILKELDKLILNEKSSYIPELQKIFPKFKETDIRNRARQIRTAILHNYTDFNLKTIDSFVQRIVRAFCYDINVDSGYRIEIDDDKVINDLSEILFSKIDEDENLQSQMLNLAEQNIDEGKNWDFRNHIKQLAKLIFTEKFKELENNENIADEYLRKEFYAKISKDINNIFESYQSRCKSIAQRSKDIFNTLFHNYAKTPEALGSKVNPIYNYLVNFLISKKIDDLIPKPTVVNSIDNFDKYLTKKIEPEQKDFLQAVYVNINPLVKEAVELYETEYIDFITAKIIRDDFYAFSLMGDLASLLPTYRQENKMMLVSDATVFLNKIIQDNDAPFIYERVGNKFDHIFIDEFQDTSGFQWQIFRPLIENTLAQGYDNMIVGDVKQSIYRFRGGDWTLLHSKVEENIGKSYIDYKTLDTNWRSRKNIIDFNDTIFLSAVQILENHDDKDKPLDYTELKDIYSDSFQKSPNSPKIGGKVKGVFFETDKKSKKSKKSQTEQEETNTQDIKTKINEKYPDLEIILPSEEKSEFEILALNSMAKEIDTLLKSKYPAKNICILVRKRQEAELVVNFLLKYKSEKQDAKQYDVISADSLYISNSQIVTIAINAMKVVNNPNDSIAKSKLIFSYSKLINSPNTDDAIFKAASSETLPKGFLPDEFSDISTNFSSLPLYDLCEKIISIFDLYKFIHESEYLRTFEDCVLEFTKKYTSDLSRFIKWWDESGIKTSIQPSDNQNAVTVMTIHKSKGLDFGTVFIPFCNWNMEENNPLTPKYIWVTTQGNNKFSNLPTLPVKYSSNLDKSHFKTSYYEEKRNMYVDALNTLYVAFTRPVDELYFYCEIPQKETIKNIGDMLYFLMKDNVNINSEYPIVSLSDHFNESENIYLSDKQHTIDIGRKQPEGEKFQISPFKNSSWDNKLSIKYHSSDFFIKSNEFIQERINYGSFMHNILSKIEVKEDLPIVLEELKMQGRITEEQKIELKQKLEKTFEIPQVKEWFSNKWTSIITECALLTTDGKIRIPDRVMVSPNETIVIDFKFGEHHDEYFDQIKEYANLLSSMKNPIYPNIKAYLFYVESGEIIYVDK